MKFKVEEFVVSPRLLPRFGPDGTYRGHVPSDHPTELFDVSASFTADAEGIRKLVELLEKEGGGLLMTPWSAAARRCRGDE